MIHRIAHALRITSQAPSALREALEYQGMLPATLHVLRVLRTRWLMVTALAELERNSRAASVEPPKREEGT